LILLAVSLDLIPSDLTLRSIDLPTSPKLKEKEQWITKCLTFPGSITIDTFVLISM
jgi:hypothetical protein